MGGMMMSLTSEVTMAPNAPPMITPMARSTTLPRMMKVLNSLNMMIPSWVVGRRDFYHCTECEGNNQHLSLRGSAVVFFGATAAICAGGGMMSDCLAALAMTGALGQETGANRSGETGMDRKTDCRRSRCAKAAPYSWKGERENPVLMGKSAGANGGGAGGSRPAPTIGKRAGEVRNASKNN